MKGEAVSGTCLMEHKRVLHQIWIQIGRSRHMLPSFQCFELTRLLIAMKVLPVSLADQCIEQEELLKVSRELKKLSSSSHQKQQYLCQEHVKVEGSVCAKSDVCRIVDYLQSKAPGLVSAELMSVGDSSLANLMGNKLQ